ncbi:MAG: Ada metal-binding domain-containing protein [Caulobacteraceae bacterium]
MTPDALKTFGTLSRLRRMQIIEPADTQMTTAAALGDIRAYAEAIAVHQDLLLDPAAATFPAPTTLALDAHNAGLKVFSRTVRPQNQYLPPALRHGDKRSATYPNQRGDPPTSCWSPCSPTRSTASAPTWSATRPGLAGAVADAVAKGPAPTAVESENRETSRGRAPIFQPWIWMTMPATAPLTTRDARFDGRLFVGVRTTGIYCRPICPARTPKRENVRFYPPAAAAQSAGFRPCLRCRPETSPDLAAWRGASNTVARALSLIEAGALDDNDVEGLADRLGVGERQLRRLFRKHLGASPVAVAQTRRVLLAKQLIHETRLPMAEVAMASGFGSVRRFNETFQQLYDRPPAALRRLGGA